MEKPNEPEFVFVNRAVGVPLNRAQPRPAGDTGAELHEPDSPAPVQTARRPLSGETRLLLIQLAAAILLAVAVAIGLSVGGDVFRAAYESLTTQNAIDLRAYLTPIEPDGGGASSESASSKTAESGSPEPASAETSSAGPLSSE